MKKKLICLLLCLVFVLSCLFGCANKSDEEAAENITEEASESAMTLAMYLMCDEVPSEDQQEAISYAVNKITKSKFKTQLKLFFYTEAEYYEKLDAAFAARKEAEAAGKISGKNEADAPKEDQTIVNDWGVTEIKYPEIDSYQVDIFYMGGYDNYLKYSEASMLSDINTELTGASKLLNDYMFPEYLSYMKSLNGGMFAVPTNATVGEYTYLLVNKKLADKFSFDTPNGYASLTSPTCDAIVSLLDDVAAMDGGNAINPGYVPMYTNLAQYELASIGKDSATKFWTVDENGKFVEGFSVLGSEYDPSESYGSKSSYLNMGSILKADSPFVQRLGQVKEYYSKNYVTADATTLENGTAAVACIKGGADIPDIYSENYEAVVIGNPTFTADDVYSNMFAVSSYSASVNRSMKIITHLNTDEEFRNLILYGIEKGYEVELEKKVFAADGTPVLDANGKQVKETVTIPANYEKSVYKDITGHEYTVITRLNKSYMMPMDKTGNILLAYGEVDEDGNVITLVKKDYATMQNSDAVVSTTIGFTPNYGGMTFDMTAMDIVRGASAEILAALEAMTYEEYTAVDSSGATGIEKFINQNRAVINAANATGAVTNPEDVADLPAEEVITTFGDVYYAWASSIKIAPELSSSNE